MCVLRGGGGAVEVHIQKYTLYTHRLVSYSYMAGICLVLARRANTITDLLDVDIYRHGISG